MNRPYPFIQRDWENKPCLASKVRCTFYDAPRTAGLIALLNAWNSATNPYRAMTDREHKRARQYARAIKGRMQRAGFVLGRDYKELSNGMLWPIRQGGAQ